MHLKDGDIRRYFDDMLPQPERQALADHLQTCPRCQGRSQQLLARMNFSQDALAGPPYTPKSIKSARLELKARLEAAPKERDNMLKRTINRVPRLAWVTITAIAILAIALTFAPVRALATSFLGIFRVERLQVIPADLENLPEAFGSGDSFEKFMAEEVQVEQFGETHDVSSQEQASAEAGIPVRLPTGMDGSPRLAVQPGGRMTFTVDYELARAVLDDIGYQDIELPEDLDGAPIEIMVQPAVLALYGDCPMEEEIKAMEEIDPDEVEIPAPENCTTLVQTTSPSISAPPGLNLRKIGEAYLQILGMSAEEAASFAANVDWSSTFVMPIPQHANYKEVSVDGTSGTLVKYWERGRAWYALMWIKDGLLYALSGPGDGETALGIAGTIK